MLKQAFSWWGFQKNGIEPKELMVAAKRIGYSGLDLLKEELWDMAKEHGLEISGVGGHGTLTDGLNKRDNQSRIVDEIHAKIEKAVQYQIPNLLVFSGNRNGISEEEGAENSAECLRKVAPAAEKAGVNLVMELLNSKVNHPDYQADSTAFGVKVCELVGSPRVKLLYDIYHMQVMEGDVIATIQNNIAHMGHFHTAGVPGRRDIDDEQELYYPAIVRAIVATGFEGYIAHEYSPKGDPIASLEHAFRVCAV
ncbi:MAG: TIM barrel protein [Armatimonadaceae bacterium]